MTTAEKLDELSLLREAATYLEIEREQLTAAIITPEKLERIRELNNAYILKYQKNLNDRARLEEEIRGEVMLRGENYESPAGIVALYSPGLHTWDTEGLEEYAKVHTEVLEFRKVGAPFVTIKGA